MRDRAEQVAVTGVAEEEQRVERHVEPREVDIPRRARFSLTIRSIGQTNPSS